jgi:isoleucyl-tRNA synthetase
MQADYEARQLGIFWQLAQRGLVYRARKPVYWSPSSRTALAEAELDYVDAHVSRAAYLRFRLLPAASTASTASELARFADDLWAAVWTTTPWTLPANQALAFGPRLAYCVMRRRGEARGPYLLVAEGRVRALEQAARVELEAVARLDGERVLAAGLEAERVLGGGRVPLIASEFVKPDSGTGIVHTAPAHGLEDFTLGLRHGLRPVCPVDEEGRFTRDVAAHDEALSRRLVGLEVLSEGTRAVLEELARRGLLLAEERYVHRYPYDWRTKQPVLVRATRQWFCRVAPIQQQVEAALQQVEFVPPSARARLLSFVRARDDWCISRQRAWGVPIPVFYRRRRGRSGDARGEAEAEADAEDAETEEEEEEEVLLSEESVQHVAALVRERGSDVWWSAPLEELLPASERGRAHLYRRGCDTMDVWFDSGVSWDAVLRQRGLRFPADAYFEGSDQHRGWFQSSLLTAVAVTGRAPYRRVITHGFVLDEAGRKMSKSLGNVVEPSAVVAQGGVDLLRLWVCSVDFAHDVSIGPKVLQNVTDLLRRLRNVGRFLLGNLADFDAARHAVPRHELPVLDRYQLHRLHELERQAGEAFEALAFGRVVHLLSEYLASLSAQYLDVIKDRLYADRPDSRRRRAAQTVLRRVLLSVLLIVAPLAPLLAEELYEALPGRAHESCFREAWPRADPTDRAPDLELPFAAFASLHDQVNMLAARARAAGLIGNNLDARLLLALPDEFRAQLGPLAEPRLLAELLTLSQVEFVSPSEPELATAQYRAEICLAAGLPPARLALTPAAGHRCPRCWRFDATAPDRLCDRCEDVRSVFPFEPREPAQKQPARPPPASTIGAPVATVRRHFCRSSLSLLFLFPDSSCPCVMGLTISNACRSAQYSVQSGVDDDGATGFFIDFGGSERAKLLYRPYSSNPSVLELYHTEVPKVTDFRFHSLTF